MGNLSPCGSARRSVELLVSADRLESPEPPRVPSDGCLSRRVVLTEEREIARLLLAPRAIANLFFAE